MTMLRNISRLPLLIVLPLLLFSMAAITEVIHEWTIRDDYQVRFSGKAASGTFSDLAGELIFSADDLANSRIDVSVSVETIDTGNATKDKHARGESWFDAEKYPEIRFTSTDFKKQASGYLATGQLTLHGVTKTVELPFNFIPGDNGGVFAGSLTVNRKDYGIDGNAFSWLVGKEFEVSLKVPVSW